MSVAANHLRRRVVALATIGLAIALVVDATSPAGGAPAAGPKGTIVFASARSGTSQIYSIRADGSQLGQLTRGKAVDTAPIFSPDGRRIVFNRASKRHASELWVMNADGHGQRKLASSGYGPAWAPDSRRLAYVGVNALVIVGADASGRRVVPGRNSGPSWSPDGRLIAFSRQVGDHDDLAVVGGNGRGLRTIRRNARARGWSPRGEIAFVGRYGTAVGLIGADGRHARRLLRGLGSGLTWSPDGRGLAFVDEKGLHVASESGRGVQNLTPKGARWDSPAWSPDSRWIALRGQFPDTIYPDILAVGADGSSFRRLTKRVPSPWGSETAAPSWRPHGATPARLGSAPTAPLPPSEAIEVPAEGAIHDPGTGRRRRPRRPDHPARPWWLLDRRGLGAGARARRSARTPLWRGLRHHRR